MCLFTQNLAIQIMLITLTPCLIQYLSLSTGEHTTHSFLGMIVGGKVNSILKFCSWILWMLLYCSFIIFCGSKLIFGAILFGVLIAICGKQQTYLRFLVSGGLIVLIHGHKCGKKLLIYKLTSLVMECLLCIR